MKFQLLHWTNDQVLEKVPVAAMALTLFYFCNPSNVLGPFATLRLTFREVNLQYYGGRVKIHLPRKKKRNNVDVNFPLVLDTFRSHFCEPRSNWKGDRRANRRSRAVAAGKGGVRFELEGQMSTFWEKNHCFKKRVDLNRR